MTNKQELIELVTKIQAGEEKYFEEFYKKSFNYVTYRVSCYVGKKNDLEDIIQIIYTEMFYSIPKLQNVDALFGWMNTVISNQSSKYYRNIKSEVVGENDMEIFDNIIDEDIDNNPELSVEQKAVAEIISELLDNLPAEQKIVIIYHYSDGLKIREIAKILDCPEGTVKSLLNYARKKLQKDIEQKEKAEGYKLHTVSTPILIYALKLSEERTGVNVQMIEGVLKPLMQKTGFANNTIKTGVVKTLLTSNLVRKVVVGSIVIFGIGGATYGIKYNIDKEQPTTIESVSDNSSNTMESIKIVSDESSDEKENIEIEPEFVEQDIVLDEKETEFLILVVAYEMRSINTDFNKLSLMYSLLCDEYMDNIFQGIHEYAYADYIGEDTYGGDAVQMTAQQMDKMTQDILGENIENHDTVLNEQEIYWCSYSDGIYTFSVNGFEGLYGLMDLKAMQISETEIKITGKLISDVIGENLEEKDYELECSFEILGTMNPEGKMLGYTIKKCEIEAE